MYKLRYQCDDFSPYLGAKSPGWYRLVPLGTGTNAVTSPLISGQNHHIGTDWYRYQLVPNGTERYQTMFFRQPKKGRRDARSVKGAGRVSARNYEISRGWALEAQYEQRSPPKRSQVGLRWLPDACDQTPTNPKIVSRWRSVAPRWLPRCLERPQDGPKMSPKVTIMGQVVEDGAK